MTIFTEIVSTESHVIIKTHMCPHDCPSRHHGLRKSHDLIAGKQKSTTEEIHPSNKWQQSFAESATFVDEATLGRGELEWPQEVGHLAIIEVGNNGRI